MKSKIMKTEIEKFNPCKGAIKFRNQYPDFKTAWNNCSRGDWMLWLASRLNVNDRILTKAKALCAKTVIHLMEDDRSKKAIEEAIKYGNNEISRDKLNKTAVAAAYAAYDAAADAAAAYAAADAAADADDAAYAAAYAAADAAYAAAYAADAAADADNATYAAADADDAADAADDTKEKNQRQTADICREILTNEVFKLIS